MDPVTRANNARVIREMEAAEREKQFGTGEVGGNESWTPPVHGTTQSGKDVTVSFGKNSRENQTLISSEHTGMSEFYDPQAGGQKGHDHYGPDGNAGKGGDRGRW